MIKGSSLAVAAVLCASPVGAAPPQHAKITHEGTAKGMAADAVETIEHDGKTYSIVSETRGRGILATFGVLNRRTSRGRITAEGLRPEEYRDERPFGWVATAKFDWEARTVTQERRGKRRRRTLPEATRTRRSFPTPSLSFRPRARNTTSSAPTAGG